MHISGNRNDSILLLAIGKLLSLSGEWFQKFNALNASNADTVSFNSNIPFVHRLTILSMQIIYEVLELDFYQKNYWSTLKVFRIIETIMN